MPNHLKWAFIVHVNAKEIPFKFNKREEKIPLWTFHLLFMLCKMYAPTKYLLQAVSSLENGMLFLIISSLKWIENCDGNNFALQISSSHLMVFFYSQVWVFALALREDQV